jgi:hypothetical protein
MVGVLLPSYVTQAAKQAQLETTLAVPAKKK